MLRPYFQEGWIAAVRAADWTNSPLQKEAERLGRLDTEDMDDRSARDLRRAIAESLYDGRLSSGKIRVPTEIVWVLADDNPGRDVTVIDSGPYLELWPTSRWQDRLRRRRVAANSKANVGDAD